MNSLCKLLLLTALISFDVAGNNCHILLRVWCLDFYLTNLFLICFWSATRTPGKQSPFSCWSTMISLSDGQYI